MKLITIILLALLLSTGCATAPNSSPCKRSFGDKVIIGISAGVTLAAGFAIGAYITKEQAEKEYRARARRQRR